MKKILIPLLSIIFLTSCSMPDVECDYCGKEIYSEDSESIDSNWCCDDCFFEALRCWYCDEKYISSFYNDTEYCDSCIDNGYVLYCCLCESYKAYDDVTIEPCINDICFIDNVCYDCLYNVALPEYCGTDFESTWGNLVACYGDLIWTTLTPTQRTFVKYPYFNENEVYVTINGNAFHSVEWCYTLGKSTEIYYCSYEEAIVLNYKPCSKCVWFE